jgi:hypothetical protein
LEVYKKIRKFIFKAIRFGFLLMILIVFYFYASCPVYRFNEPVPFHGNYLHNPYQEIDSAQWRKYNFQVQSYAWGGITDGRLNSNALIDSIYHMLFYDYVATSDYQKINTHSADKEIYIPTYEHGFNIPKTHQVCIGANEVLWRDYPLFQTIHNKQHIIHLLKERSEIVSLAHPRLMDSYTLEDMKYLSGYDLIEVLNNLRVSIEHWDEALTYGHLVYLLANDDAHNVMNPNEVGRRFTLIHSSSLNHDSVVQALLSGKAYGVDFHRIDDEPLTEKVGRIPKIPFLKSARLIGDSLVVKVSKPVYHIQFYGRRGELLKETDHISEAGYTIRPTDPYVRVQVHCYDATMLYLNPVTRHESPVIEKQQTAFVDEGKTWLVRIFAILLIGAIFVIWLKFRKK